LLWKGRFAFRDLQLLSEIAFVKYKNGSGSFRTRVGRIRDEMQFRLIGFVVMPNHVHLLMSEPPRSTPSIALQKLKLRSSQKLRGLARSLRTGPLTLDEVAAQPPVLWQARFYDFNVYSSAKHKEKLIYMHANPVIRGLAKHPDEWPWSSWSFYEQK
jgi:putative transposase